MKKILIADDAAFIRMMIKDVLNRNGYNDLYEAGDGLQAVGSFKTNRPDLVLMDLSMPVMDGLEEPFKQDRVLKTVKTFIS